MGKAIRASALVLLLACSAQAGHMQNESPEPPLAPPPAPNAVQEPTTGGEIGYGLTEIALILLNSVSPLL